MSVVFLGLGSNLGDRVGNLRRAADALYAIPEVDSLRLSNFRCTPPVGGPQQPDYVNAVLRCETSLSPKHLLRHMLMIEARLGRVRQEHNGPRTIDIDLLMYGSVQMASADLQLPHPRMEQRRFVLEPLAELAPKLPLAGGSTAHQRLAQMMND
ncbi:MAG: 2-amino-4-hydroxy-6-hydroxymethyldihydropteridine diphosphokinase [Planctomycetes bacterium]|nr:2-amino-4-hydroxy-6-hydroxymethyldihydropteridine diphosphokinase [Planctomycetota bacterium]MCP4861058.1 2-amino-4-hydroxy-6-hydroxymethyldihydropteridine diphosphokinase [Planctomycetota bacterium]